MALLQVAIVFATAFLVTFCTVPLSRKIAVVLGAIDQPGYRRVNKGPVPRCGGIALYLGLCGFPCGVRGLAILRVAAARLVYLERHQLHRAVRGHHRYVRRRPCR